MPKLRQKGAFPPTKVRVGYSRPVANLTINKTAERVRAPVLPNCVCQVAGGQAESVPAAITPAAPKVVAAAKKEEITAEVVAKAAPVEAATPTPKKRGPAPSKPTRGKIVGFLVRLAAHAERSSSLFWNEH